MRVFYDISVLGEGQFNPLARTGVARVIENLAYGLASSSECDLSLCTSLPFEIVRACLSYLESNSNLKKATFVHSSFLTIVYSKVLELRKILDINDKKISGATDSNIIYKSLIKMMLSSLEENSKFIEDYPYSIPFEKLISADIFHATFYPIPEQTRRNKNTRIFLTVYDLIPILYPHFFENFKDSLSIDSLHPDDWVFCISHATKNDLCNYLKTIDPAKVFVTHLAALPQTFYQCSNSDKLALVRGKYCIPAAPYLLSLSTLEPRKNIDHVIRCFARLVQEQNIRDLVLVLVGNRGWDYSKILEEVSNQPSLRDRIIITGSVADEDLAAIYSGAMAFVYPSFYEGFGLPPLEAMQCGVPVITSNTSSLPEVVGDAGIMVAPTDADSLCHSLWQIYSQPSLREAMSLKSLEQAKKFSWEKCTQETIAAYKIALS